MKIFILLLIIFIISFYLLFKLVHKGNQGESEEEKLNFPLVILVTVLLALLPVAAIGVVLFVVLGSTSAINTFFSLDINSNQLIILAISFLIYYFILDSVIEIVVRHILGKGVLYHSVILLARIGAFNIIGYLVGLTLTISIIVSISMAVFILLIELLYNSRDRQKTNENPVK